MSLCPNRVASPRRSSSRRYVQYGAQSHPLSPGKEDADLWRDADGHFHAISHSFDACGYHSFSRDGWAWSFAPVVEGDDELCAFTYTVEYEDGAHQTYARRERPHVVMGADGVTPIALSTSVTYGEGDASYTHIQPIGPRRAGPRRAGPAVRSRAAPSGEQAVRTAHLGPQPSAERRGRAPAAHALVDGCDDHIGGNDFGLRDDSRGVTATLSRTGLEGLTYFDDGAGNRTHFVHDDFVIELRLGMLPGADGKRFARGAEDSLVLGNAQDSTSLRNCSLMAAGCGYGHARHDALFTYRCIADVEIQVRYSLEPSRSFVSKTLSACVLQQPSAPGLPKACDPTANLTVVRSVVWEGLQPIGV